MFWHNKKHEKYFEKKRVVSGKFVFPISHTIYNRNVYWFYDADDKHLAYALMNKKEILNSTEAKKNELF